ncbi:lipocalin family protein [Luteimonas sp. MJ246]|uniref:lipocalin family protein n=1 Tax=Luteimonas sp. MJ174 TaxID=3129237 RepID=UPI0031BA6905
MALQNVEPSLQPPHLKDCDPGIDATFAGPLAACRGTTDYVMTQHPRRVTKQLPLSIRTLCAAALCLLVAACAGGPGATAHEDAVDVRMPPIEVLMGDWYVAARVPWFGERGEVASTTRLALSGENRIELTRTWRDGFAEPLESDSATVRREGHGDRLWKVRIYGVVPTRLRMLEVATDGSWLLIDSPGREHAWILTRARQVEDEAYLELERRIRSHGVNTDRLRRVPQVPEQEGRLGFEPAASPTPGS